MTMIKRLAAGAATAVLAAAVFGAPALAQETTGGINGVAHTSDGAVIPNAPVTIVYTPTNQTFTTSTDASGLFSVRQLPPGGPYRVTVKGAAGEVSQVVPSIGLGAAYDVQLGAESAASAAANTVAEVTVTATPGATRQLQTGPRSTFNAQDVETLPSFSRDFKDLARLNPFVVIDTGNTAALQIAGNNFRSNTIYVDAVRQSDDFGIGTSGYPTLRNPISVDLIQSLNVEVAPYDVSYGQFTGGVLNISTKSGSNDFHGSAFYEYDSDHLGSGRRIRDRVVKLPFQDKTYGFTFSGPIWQDHVFFQFGYEKYEGLSTSFLNGPVDGAGVVNPVVGVTSAQIDRITSILQSRYGLAAGAYGTSSPLQDEKYFGKLTWQINNQHRLVFEAQSTDGGSFTSGSGATSLALASNSYTLDQPQVSYSGYLYSNWTPSFSTELSYTDRTVARQPEVGVAGTPEYDIYLSGSTSGPVIYAGTNYSYQANYLTTENKLFRARGNYSWGQHSFLAGYEHEDRNAVDLFIQRANGVFTFTSIDDLAAGRASTLQYANTFDNNSATAAIPVDYTIHTFYLQDEWRLLSNLTLRLGLRDELYAQDQKPKANPYLASTLGVDNTTNIDGLNTLMPRFGFNYRPFRGLTLSGGLGKFSGGSPDVYIYNAFNGTGNITGSVTCNGANSATANCAGALTNVTGAIPTNVLAANTASANLGTGSTTIISKDFKPPAVWKASLSAVYTLNLSDFGWTGTAGRIIGDDWRLHGDYLYQVTDEGILLQDLDTLTHVIGTAPDGRPIFDPNRPTPNRTDLLLTNTNKGHNEVYALGVGKSFRNGIDFDFTYTHTVAKDAQPLTSSVSTSNYKTNAFTDPNNPDYGDTVWAIPEVSKLQLGWTHNFVSDFATRVRVFAQRRTGHPYSYTYQLAYDTRTGFDTTGFGVTNTSNTFSTTYNDELVYVPKTDSSGNVTATSDPKVSYAFNPANSTAPGPNNLAGFNDFLKATGLIKYAGSVAPKNSFYAKDVTTVDLQFTQEIPAFFPTHAKAELYFSIFNVGNLINSSWGVLEQYDFPYLYQAVQAKIIGCGTAGATCAPGQTTQYQYTGYGQSTTRSPTIITSSSGNPPPSTWALKLGVRYKF